MISLFLSLLLLPLTTAPTKRGGHSPGRLGVQQTGLHPPIRAAQRDGPVWRTVNRVREVLLLLLGCDGAEQLQVQRSGADANAKCFGVHSRRVQGYIHQLLRGLYCAQIC